MFIRMRESKGFTLVELMIVVAIIGILAAAAVPYYQKYVQKSRMTSLVFPLVRTINNNLASYFAVSGTPSFPTSATWIWADASTMCATPTYTLTGTTGATVHYVIPTTGCQQLSAIAGQGFTLTANMNTAGTQIVGWTFSGQLALSLGLTGMQ